MPRIFQLPPDPGMQAVLDYAARLREEQLRRERERAEERERQKQRAIIGGGLALGAVGGALLAPAGIASSAATGAAVTATGASATGALITSTLTGAAVGAQIGQQFAGGDIAGGVTTAAGAARGIIQAQDDQQFYGGPVTAQDRALYKRAALKVGLNPEQLMAEAVQSGQTIPNIIKSRQIQQADVKQLDALARNLDLGVTGSFLKQHGATYPTGIDGLVEDLRSEGAKFEAEAAGQQAFARISGQRDAEAQAAVQREGMEYRFDPRALAQRSADLKAIDEDVGNGDLTVEQGARIKAAMPRLVPTAVPRRTPRTIEEDEDISSKTGLIYVPDTRGGRRHVGNVRGDEDVAGTILKHQANKGRAEARTVSIEEATNDYLKAQTFAEQIKAGTFQPAGAAQPGQAPGGAAAPAQAPQDVQLQQRTEAAVERLLKVKRFFPANYDKWVPQMAVRFIDDAELVSKAFLDKINRGETLTPEEIELARFVAKLIEIS